MDLDATMVVAAITVVCGSSCFLSAAVDAATDLVSTTVVVMDADATAVADADSFDFLKHFCFFIISITFARGDFFTPLFLLSHTLPSNHTLYLCVLLVYFFVSSFGYLPATQPSASRFSSSSV